MNERFKHSFFVRCRERRPRQGYKLPASRMEILWAGKLEESVNASSKQIWMTHFQASIESRDEYDVDFSRRSYGPKTFLVEVYLADHCKGIRRQEGVMKVHVKVRSWSLNVSYLDEHWKLNCLWLSRWSRSFLVLKFDRTTKAKESGTSKQQKRVHGKVNRCDP